MSVSESLQHDPPTGLRRSLLGNVALLVVTIALPLLAAAGTLRLLDCSAPEHPAPVLAPELAGLPRLHGVFALAESNARGVFKGALFRTNSFGVRGPDYAIPKPDDVFWIVIIGDSFTMGSGVCEEEAYPARVQAMLNARSPVRIHEVINLGLGAVLANPTAGSAIDQFGAPHQGSRSTVKG